MCCKGNKRLVFNYCKFPSLSTLFRMTALLLPEILISRSCITCPHCVELENNVLLTFACTVKEAKWKGNGSCSQMDTQVGKTTTHITDMEGPFHMATCHHLPERLCLQGQSQSSVINATEHVLLYIVASTATICWGCDYSRL